MAPTIIEHASPDAEISVSELFGPVTCLYRVPDFAEALRRANQSPYGLTACIHTRSVHRALEFTRRSRPEWPWSTPAPSAASPICLSAG